MPPATTSCSSAERSVIARTRPFSRSSSGHSEGPDGSWIGFDTRPVAVKRLLATASRRLGVDHIDIYRPGRLDPSVPIEETVGAIADLVKADTSRDWAIRSWRGDHPSRTRRSSCFDLQIDATMCGRRRDLPAPVRARHRGNGLRCPVARPLERLETEVVTRLSHLSAPRFTGENLERNERLVEAIRQMATEKGATASQLAIAWVLAKGPAIVPLIGARTRTQLAESLGALRVTLTPADVQRIEGTIPPSAVAGTRYDEHQMRARQRAIEHVESGSRG